MLPAWGALELSCDVAVRVAKYREKSRKNREKIAKNRKIYRGKVTCIHIVRESFVADVGWLLDATEGGLLKKMI